jgi:hypothetical protein
LKRVLALSIAMLAVLATPAQGQAPATGGVEFLQEDLSPIPRETVPGATAVLLESGYAAAPELAPPAVQEAIWAANELQDKPYRYGGGHQLFADTAFDCSGTVSYALNAAGLLKRPLDSTSFMRWGLKGPGQWITVFANRGHAYVVIAGLRLDTSSAGDPAARGRGPRWRSTQRSSKGYRVRHPVGA